MIVFILLAPTLGPGRTAQLILGLKPYHTSTGTSTHHPWLRREPDPTISQQKPHTWSQILMNETQVLCFSAEGIHREAK